ncbi:hypothetical protein FD754_001013 [Muntiacus muntjak]|uniref:Uncharacterized protein n=1 Tax=Muntiacus muntjak TaxID=9888 RepID=A0A5N3W6G2_MUNMU|nr:hypothetical protein FD754_001013 [Muntiacus muntjak]
MYHSLSETRHPLQPEEQEVGTDPLLSYSNKPGGNFFLISTKYLLKLIHDSSNYL